MILRYGKIDEGKLLKCNYLRYIVQELVDS